MASGEMTSMPGPRVHVDSVTRLDPGPAVAQFSIDLPRGRDAAEGHLIDIAGWAVGRRERIETMYVMSRDSVLASAPVDVARPDVSQALPDLGAPVDCGFRRLIAAPLLPSSFEFTVCVASADGSPQPVARIKGRRDPLPQPGPHEAVLDPVMVTSLGRTGTTWLMHLLLRHPAIGGFDRWPYELSAAGRAATMFRSMAEWPHGPHQPSQWVPSGSGSWWGTEQPYARKEAIRWQSGPAVELAARTARSQVSSFYRALAAPEAAPGTSPAAAGGITHFAEKFVPDHQARLTAALFPDHREIVLVRDFRDMVASIIAFNRKRGYADFGAEQARDDADLADVLATSVSDLMRVADERSDALVVRYEDLVQNERRVLMQILDHLGLDSSAGMVEQVSAAAHRALTAMAEHRSAPSVMESVGRWRTDLSSEVARACGDAFGAALSRFGYR